MASTQPTREAWTATVTTAHVTAHTNANGARPAKNPATKIITYTLRRPAMARKRRSKLAELVEHLAGPPLHDEIQQTVDEIARDEHQTRVPEAGTRTHAREVRGERQVPGILVEEVADVLQLSELRGGELQARELSVDAVEHADDQRQQHADTQPPVVEQDRDHACHEQRRERDLIGVTSVGANQSHQEILEWSVEVLTGKVERALLDVVDEHRPRAPPLVGESRPRRTYGSTAPRSSGL